MRASINPKGRLSRIYTHEMVKVGHTIRLDPVAAKHLMTVLRHQVGDRLIVFNGDGHEYHGLIVAATRADGVHIAIDDAEQRDVEAPLDIHLVQAIGRGERMDWAIQKATELGVRRITPLITERVAVKLDPKKASSRIERWQSIAIHAAEQSGRVVVPKVDAPLELHAFKTEPDRPCWVLDPNAVHGLAEQPATQTCTLVVGPEGGLTDPELAWLNSVGAQGVRLGPRILRTETAGPAMIAALLALWGDFR